MYQYIIIRFSNSQISVLDSNISEYCQGLINMQINGTVQSSRQLSAVTSKKCSYCLDISWPLSPRCLSVLPDRVMHFTSPSLTLNTDKAESRHPTLQN